MKSPNAKNILLGFSIAAAAAVGVGGGIGIATVVEKHQDVSLHQQVVAAQIAAQQEHRKMVAHTEAATVKIESDPIAGYECASHCGSGWFIDSTGDIQTANHVANGKNEKIIVTLADGTQHNAKVVSENLAKDTTLLHVDGVTGHKFLEWADSDKIMDGDTVVEVGNPFHLGISVSQGVVSAVHRDYLGHNFMQFDAASNPGNSGGPVVDSEGKAVGMSDTIYTLSRQNSGIAFAIPSNDIIKTLPAALRPKNIATAPAATLG